ncbi:MAG: tetratricopeptide repeat protein [Candidatus Hodarchaeales archaeon]
MKEDLIKAQSLANSGEFDKAINLLGKVFSKASIPEEKIDVENNIAVVYSKKGDIEAARDLLEDNLRKSIEINYGNGEESALYYLSSLYTSKGDPELGHQLAKRLIDRFQDKRSDSTEFKARIALLQAKIDMHEGNYDEAIKRGKDSVKLFLDLGIQEEAAESLNFVATSYYRQGEFNKALDTYRELMKLTKKSNDRRNESKCYNNIALIYRVQGNYNLAMDYFRKSLEIVEAIGDLYMTGINYINLGRTSKDKGDLHVALDYLKRAEKLLFSPEARNFRGLTLTLGEIAETYQKLANNSKAREFFEKTFNYYQKTGLVELYSERLSSFVDLLIDVQELDKAKEVLAKLKDLADNKHTKIDSIYYRYQESNLELAFGNLGNSRKKYIALLADVELAGYFNITIKILLNLARIFFESYTIKGELKDLVTARDYVERALERSTREKLFPNAVDALIVKAMFQVNETNLNGAVKTLERALNISEEKGLDSYKQRVAQLIEQFMHREKMMTGSFSKLEASRYDELAIVETSLVIKSALGRDGKVQVNRKELLARSYLVAFLITPAGPHVHYADLLPLKGESTQETAYGQLGLFITFAIQQGRGDNVPEGLFGPLPFADMEDFFVYVYSSPNLMIGPCMVCFMIPKESISLFLDRQILLNKFEDFFRHVNLDYIDNKSMNKLKKDLFILE